MIRTPPRAVTRFLIPFIDVLILLFCIFLLMPFVSTQGDAGNSSGSEDIAKLKLELQLAQRRLEEIQKRSANLFDRYHVKLLEIDRDTGKLLIHEESGRREIRTLEEAKLLTFQERLRAGSREACFMILYPRTLTGFPTEEQVQRYEQWFRDVPHAFDNPWGG